MLHTTGTKLTMAFDGTVALGNYQCQETPEVFLKHLAEEIRLQAELGGLEFIGAGTGDITVVGDIYTVVAVDPAESYLKHLALGMVIGHLFASLVPATHSSISALLHIRYGDGEWQQYSLQFFAKRTQNIATCRKWFAMNVLDCVRQHAPLALRLRLQKSRHASSLYLFATLFGLFLLTGGYVLSAYHPLAQKWLMALLDFTFGYLGLVSLALLVAPTETLHCHAMRRFFSGFLDTNIQMHVGMRFFFACIAVLFLGPRLLMYLIARSFVY